MKAMLSVLLPELVLTGGLLLSVLVGAFASRKTMRALTPLWILAALITLLMVFYTGTGLAASTLKVGPYERFFDLLFLLTGLVGLFLVWDALPDRPREFEVLYLSALLGMMILGKAQELITLFFALELLSFSFYFLVGYARSREEALEGALKYFLMGAVSAAFFAFGIALIYMTTGTTVMTELFRSGLGGDSLTRLGLLFLGVGLLFKVAAFPFQFWTPDVYSGAPTPVVAVLNAAPKAAGFLALLRVWFLLYDRTSPAWTGVLVWTAVLTMFFGNWVALRQKELKRMLAYSTIAHVGYLLTALLIRDVLALKALAFYLTGYAIMTLGAFAVIQYVGTARPTVQDLTGLAQRRPLLAWGLTLFLVSLAGIPGTVGFATKAFLFYGLLKQGYTALTVVAFLNAVISAYYYLQPVVAMFMMEGEPATVRRAEEMPWTTSVVQVMALLVVYFGVFPFAVWHFLDQLFRRMG